MRFISYSLLGLVALGVWDLRSKDEGGNSQQLAGMEAPQGVDTTVIGGSIPVSHIVEWEERNRLQRVSSGHRTYYQAFPGEEDESFDKNKVIAGEIDFMATGSIKRDDLNKPID